MIKFIFFWFVILVSIFGFFAQAGISTGLGPVWLSDLGRKKRESLARLASYTKLRFVPTSYKGPYIKGVYRGLMLKAGAYGKGGAGTKIRLTLPDASTTSSFKKRGKSDFKRILKHFPSGNAIYERSLVFRRKKAIYRESDARTDTYEMRVLMNHLCDLINIYPHIIQFGGEAVPILEPLALQEKHILNNMAERLLREIGQFTASEFKSRLAQVHCKLCLTHFSSHKAALGRFQSARYYACRTCQQSRAYYEDLKLILALDKKMQVKWIQKENSLYINGFKHRKLFDFDKVEIRDASDKAVAAFAIKAGNDTDAYRTERYKEIPCCIMEGNAVSDNTILMLKRVFGRVKINCST